VVVVVEIHVVAFRVMREHTGLCLWCSYIFPAQIPNKNCMLCAKLEALKLSFFDFLDLKIKVVRLFDMLQTVILATPRNKHPTRHEVMPL
jgi:hypothetical protein